MIGVLAACWRDDTQNGAYALFNKAKAAFCKYREVVPSDSINSENMLVCGFSNHQNYETAFGHDSKKKVFVACAGWIGIWEKAEGHHASLDQIAEKFRLSESDALRSLFGHYALVIADTSSERLVATSDHPGLFPLYYASVPGIVLVSSSSLCLANALGNGIRQTAVLALYLNSQTRSPDSAFEGIQRLGTGKKLIITNGSAVVESTWSPFAPRANYRRIEDCAEDGSKILKATCRAITDNASRSVFDLTGGLDSRLVVSASAALDLIRDVTVTGPDNSRDVKISKGIASKYEWAWHQLNILSNSQSDRWKFFRKAVYFNDGEMSGHNGDGTLIGKTRLSQNFSLSITGGMGELLRDFFWQQEVLGLGSFQPVDLDRVFRYRFISNFQSVPHMIFAGNLVQDYIAQEIKTGRTLIDSQSNVPRSMQLDALYIWKNTGHVGRYIASSSVVLTTLAPMGMRPLVEFGLSIPYRFRKRGNLARYMINRQSEGLAKMPTTYGGSAQPFSLLRPHLYLQNSLYVLKRSVHKARQLIYGNNGLQNGSSKGAGLDAIYNEARDREMLNPANLVSASLYKEEGLQKLVSKIRKNEHVPPHQLSAFISVELICRALHSNSD